MKLVKVNKLKILRTKVRCFVGILSAILIFTSCTTYQVTEFKYGEPVEIRTGPIGNKILLQGENKIVRASDIHKKMKANAANKDFEAAELAAVLVFGSVYLGVLSWIKSMEIKLSDGDNSQQVFDVGTGFIALALAFGYYADWRNAKGAEKYNEQLKEKNTVSLSGIGVSQQNNQNNVALSWSF